jgi:hypothetical protein
MAEWKRARLIPVYGISSEREAEVRATSAVLAVIEVVRDLSIALFSPFGAPKAQRASVQCFAEVPFTIGTGTNAIRPDGLVKIEYGKTEWVALIEVKTGTANLAPDQVNAYWEIAREHGFDAVITISNELAAVKDQHPTEGLRVRANSKVRVHHISWSALLSTCQVIKDHRGVSDPEQAWILNELIRYLLHPNSGVTGFDDMGGDWVTVRDGVREDSLRKTDPAVKAVCSKWDGLLRYTALQLEASIGQPVAQQLPPAQRDPARRLQYLVDRLMSGGQLDGSLRIPNTVGDLELLVDLRTRRISASVAVTAPDDRRGRARCTWLASQLGEKADPRMVIEAYPKNARTPTAATLAAVREDKDVLLGEDKREPARFRITLSREMGLARKGGRKTGGFIESVLALVTDFYGTVVQELTPWTPSAPRLAQRTQDESGGHDAEPPSSPPVLSDAESAQAPSGLVSSPEEELADQSITTTKSQSQPWPHRVDAAPPDMSGGGEFPHRE